jgi:hypothetical protein
MGQRFGHGRFFDNRFVDHRSVNNRFLTIGFLTTTVSSSAITTISSSFLISFRLASLLASLLSPWVSLGGTPGTPTILRILATDRFTTASIGLIWPCQCNRNLPSAVITTAR